MKKRRLLTRLKAWRDGSSIDDCRDDLTGESVFITLYNRYELWIIKQSDAAFQPFRVLYQSKPSGGYNDWYCDDLNEVAKVVKNHFGKKRRRKDG